MLWDERPLVFLLRLAHFVTRGRLIRSASAIEQNGLMGIGTPQGSSADLFQVGLCHPLPAIFAQHRPSFR
ncbi:hypothetical protein XH88_35400 [Bradyrhizobium sp. CCBAU 51627]|nr:hypothetical protein [Bradyrhizobium sp. CCBAU 51627]